MLLRDVVSLHYGDVRRLGIFRFSHDQGQQLQGRRDQLHCTDARAFFRYLKLPCDQSASNCQSAGDQVDVLYAGRDQLGQRQSGPTVEDDHPAVCYTLRVGRLKRTGRTCKKLKLGCVTGLLPLICGCQSLSTPEPLIARVVTVGCEKPPAPEAWYMARYVPNLTELMLNELSPSPTMATRG